MGKKLKLLKVLALSVPTITLGACSQTNKQPSPSNPVTPTSEPTVTNVERFNNAVGNAIRLSNYTIVEKKNGTTIKSEINGNSSKVENMYYTFDGTNYEYWKQSDGWFKKETDHTNPLTTYNAIFAGFKDVSDAENGKLTIKDANGTTWTGSVSEDGKCFDTSNGEVSYSVSKIGSTVVNVPEATLYVNKTTADIWQEVKTAALNEQNFTYKVYEGPYLRQTTLIDNENSQVGDKIYTTDDGKNYTFEQDGDIWYRSESDGANPSTEISAWLNGIVLDGSTEKMDGINFLVAYDRVNDCSVLTYSEYGSLTVIKDNMAWEISKIGETTVSLPENWQEKTPDVPIEEQIVDEHGNYNISLIKSAVSAWMKGNNAQGQDYLAYKMRNDDIKTEKVMFVKPTDTTLQIGAIYSTPAGLPKVNFAIFEVENSKIDYSSTRAFEESLYNMTRVGFSNTYQVSGLYTNNNTKIQADNVLSKLGKTSEAVWAYETDQTTSSFIGFCYKMVFMTDQGTLISTVVETPSKEDVVNNADTWQVSQNETTIIETGVENVEQSRSVGYNERGLNK